MALLSTNTTNKEPFLPHISNMNTYVVFCLDRANQIADDPNGLGSFLVTSVLSDLQACFTVGKILKEAELNPWSTN